MVLRKLQIFGFKSFAEKSEISFGDGITAIVGPNGCGKSNVVDAIRWVFGEQKASALRSSMMHDVIFSGTQKRQPLNFAEVSLVIENDKGLLPIEYSEVMITRRVYRSGESEYRLNKVPCRLRDITNLFIDTGIGSNYYTTIENNMINTILSDKAEERRILFEEAAGIGKFKQRRKESERKLEYTKLDLARINDKVRDREQDVRMLARQVEKARKYRSWYDQLKAMEIGYESRHYRQLAEASAARAAALESLDAKLESVRARLAADESRIEQMSLQALEKEAAVANAGKRVAESSECIANLDKQILLLSETLKHLGADCTRFDGESGKLAAQIEEKSLLRGAIEKGLVEAETQLERRREELTAIQGELQRFDGALAEKKELTNALAQEHIRLINAIGDQRNVAGALESALRNALDTRERLEAEIAAASGRRDEFSERIEECSTQLRAASEQYANLLSSRTALVGRIEREDERYRELLAQEKRIEARIDGCRSQLDFLKDLDAQFEGYGAGVKALLTRDVPGRIGIAADLVRVSDEAMTGMVDRVLGSEIQTVVFRTDAELRQAIDILRKEELGSARMVSLERLPRSQTGRMVREISGTTPLRAYIETSEEYQALADSLFGGVFVASTLEQAMDLASKSEWGAVVVTGDGVVCHPNGTVVAGSQSAKGGILMRKKLIESLPGQIDALRKEYQSIIREKERCILTRDEAKTALAEVNEKLSAGQRKQQEQETHIKHYQRELDAADEKIRGAQAQLDAAVKRIGELEGGVTQARGELEILHNRSAEIEMQADASKNDVDVMEKQRHAIAERCTAAQLRIQGDMHKIAQNRGDIERLTSDIAALNSRIQQIIEERQRALTRMGELQQQSAQLAEELAAQTALREELQRALSDVREEYNKMLADIEEIRRESKTLRSEMDGVSAQIFDLRNEQTRAEEKMQGMRQRIFELYRVDLSSPPEDVAIPQEDDAQLEESIRLYKERVSRLTGQVNMAAPEEYEAKNAELIELIKQRDDLQTAVDDLEKAIRKLNKEARERFIETFELVKGHFTAMFTALFEGGEVRLSLEENADPLEAAISIDVRPAGKKMRGVQLLSGGERALTAISLLFALYKVKPSAYCILDELDAPLDDANIGRFVRILKEFAASTQFIIITHNKRTMEAADVLYGVTHQEQGVSSVVSVMLDNALAYAA